MNNFEFLRATFSSAFTPRKKRTIDEWVDEVGIMLPSNTAEPGKYRVSRTPYIRDVLKRMSPNDPTKEVVLVFGSQMSKTTTENVIMTYYMEEDPSPIAFAFSDDANLKNYIKNKFDPMLASNPRIKQLLRSDGSASADSMTSKLFPGGFIKFLSGKSGASMRSDSVRIIIADEVDGMGETKEGDIRGLLRKRVNTFKETSKICMSSTPINNSTIMTYLKETTYNRWYVPCPRCGKMITLTRDTLRWKKDDDSNTVIDAWMECPECKGKIRNEEKELMNERGEWRPTNPNADPSKQGYWLPSYYAPVGWISWKDCADELVEALESTEEKKEERLTSYTNTIDALPYITGAIDSQEWRPLYEKSKQSKYVRQRIPSWVNVLTTGADVQGNRFEISLYGWGKMGRSLAIDHWIVPIERNGLDDPMSDAWINYSATTLEYDFVREDGIHLQTVANAIDSSYQTDNINNWYRRLRNDLKARTFIIRGRDSLSGFTPVRKDEKRRNGGDIVFWAVPVSDLKKNLYSHLKASLEPKANPQMPFYMEYPNDYDTDYYIQLYSEQWIKEKGAKKWKWVKITGRERNEILDCTVYNLAMFYHLGLGRMSSQDWDNFDQMQKKQASSLVQQTISRPRQRNRIVSKAID